MPTEPAPEVVYGYCPKCHKPSVSRERRLNGNDECIDGHTYPSASALASLPAPSPLPPALVEAVKKLIRINQTWVSECGCMYGTREGGRCEGCTKVGVSIAAVERELERHNA